jgi:hypothetical protein
MCVSRECEHTSGASGFGLALVGMTAAVVGVTVWRWLSGQPMVRHRWQTPTGATFWRAAVPPSRAGLRLPRIWWAWWPGWQRAVVRWALTGLVVAGWYAPLLTALVVALLAAVTISAAAYVRRHRPPVMTVTTVLMVAAPPARAVLADTAAHGDSSWQQPVPSRVNAGQGA